MFAIQHKQTIEKYLDICRLTTISTNWHPSLPMKAFIKGRMRINSLKHRQLWPIAIVLIVASQMSI